MDQRLRKIMASVFNIDKNDISDFSSMDNIARWDSLKHMELILAIEEDFDLPKLSADEIVKMTSVANIKAVLHGKGIAI
jgi:acyl carrier protein